MVRGKNTVRRHLRRKVRQCLTKRPEHKSSDTPGRSDGHPYQLFLQLEEIEHRTTKVRRPQSNGFVEHLQRTLLDDHFRVIVRKKFYDGIEAMQTDLDTYLVRYNTERPHQGRDMKGRKTADVFVRCLPKPKTPREEKMKKAARTSRLPGAATARRLPYLYTPRIVFLGQCNARHSFQDTISGTGSHSINAVTVHPLQSSAPAPQIFICSRLGTATPPFFVFCFASFPE